MKYVYFKRTSKTNESTPLLVHFGIVRTGSSTVRQFIRRHSNLLGKSWRPFLPNDPLEQQNEALESAHYLLLEHPFPVHLLTKRPVIYHTTIRNPIEQINSLYHWQRNQNDRSESFDTFVLSLPDCFNMNCRWLHALSKNAIDDSMIEQHLLLNGNRSEGFYSTPEDDQLFDSACRVLDSKFELVAPLEEMAYFVLGLALRASMPQLPLLQRVNFSTKLERFDFTKLCDETQAKLLSCTREDMKLYERIKQNFASTKASIMAKQPAYQEYLSLCSQAEQMHLSSSGLILDGQDILSPKSDTKIDHVSLTPESKQYYLEAQDFMEPHEFI